jgi:hypothetical protein
MARTGYFFIGGLWAVGLITGLVLARAPDLVPLPTPHLMVPLIVGLIVDLAIRPASNAGRIAPISMNERAIAVIGAALIGFGATALLSPR